MAGYNLYNNKLFQNKNDKIERPPSISIFQKQPAAKITKDITKPTTTSSVNAKESTLVHGKSHTNMAQKSESVTDSSVEKQSTIAVTTQNKPTYRTQFKKTPLLVQSVSKASPNIDKTCAKEEDTNSKAPTSAPLVPPMNSHVQTQFRKAQFNYKPQPPKSVASSNNSDILPQFKTASDMAKNETYLPNGTITSPVLPATNQNPIHVADDANLNEQVAYKSNTLEYLDQLQKDWSDLGASSPKSKRAVEEDESSDIDVSQIVKELSDEQAAKKRRVDMPIIPESPPQPESVVEVMMPNVPIALPQPPSLLVGLEQPPVVIARNEAVAPNPFKHIRVVETPNSKQYVIYVSDPRVKIQIEMELDPKAHDK